MVLLALGLLLVGWLAVYWTWDDGIFYNEGFVASTSGLLVLEDCDNDFRIPPFTDAVISFDAHGKPIRRVTGLNLCETIGGCRALSVARDGRYFTVCQNVGHNLSAYEPDTGRRLWSLNGGFNAATISQNGLIYALSSAGTIDGGQTLLIDPKGQIIRQAPVGGFDLAVDDTRKVLWLVGKNIKKCDLEGRVLLEVNSIGWCAVSLDLCGDGSIWVAERQHPNVTQSTNRLLKLSAEGQLLKALGLPFSPGCLRVDRSDGSVWVTGGASQTPRTRRLLEATEKSIGRLPLGTRMREFLTRSSVSSRTRKYDQNGALLCELRRGGFSLDIDQADGSVWIGGKEKVYQYSRRGTLLGQARGLSPDQKYIAIIPGQGKTREQAPPNSR